MLSENTRLTLLVLAFLSPFIAIIGYLIYLDITNLGGLMLGGMILNSLFNIKSGLTTGKTTISRRFSSGEIEFKSDEKPLRYAGSIMADFMTIIFSSIVLYSIYVEDIIDIAVP
jgi:hypothetical protein